MLQEQCLLLVKLSIFQVLVIFLCESCQDVAMRSLHYSQMGFRLFWVVSMVTSSVWHSQAKVKIPSFTTFWSADVARVLL